MKYGIMKKYYYLCAPVNMREKDYNKLSIN